MCDRVRKSIKTWAIDKTMSNHFNYVHGEIPWGRAALSAFQAAPRKTIIAESSIIFSALDRWRVGLAPLLGSRDEFAGGGLGSPFLFDVLGGLGDFVVYVLDFAGEVKIFRVF